MKTSHTIPLNRKVAFAAFAVALTGAVFAGIEDKVLMFSTPGTDRYADGTAVVDGECYALVWSPAGTTFSGFNADGTTVSPEDRLVLAGALAKDGRCPEALFQVPSRDYEELKGGEWTFCLVDTRTASGVPAGVCDGKPVRVNRWGAVIGGVKEKPADVSSLRSSASGSLAKGATSGVSSKGVSNGGTAPVRANYVSAVPPTVKTPTITAFEVQGGEVWLSVADTVPYLSYTILSGETPTSLKTDYFSDVVDGGNGSEIAIGTRESLRRRFFRVTRAEQ